MRTFVKAHRHVIVLILAAFATRFLFLWHPAEVVFDETHFGKFVSAYFTHEYYFDIHPPLGKLLIAALAALLGYDGGAAFSAIGESVPVSVLLALRFLPAFAGALLPLALFSFVRAAGGSPRAAFLAGMLAIADTALLVQSKFALLDIFLLLFGGLAIVFFLWARGREGMRYFVFVALAALFAGLSFSIKWTGLAFWGTAVFVLLIDALHFRRWKRSAAALALFLIVPAVAYASVFAAHFMVLGQSGPGGAFMSAAFQSTLEGSAAVWEGESPGFTEKFFELNRVMFTASAGLAADHPDGSRWYEWPLLKKPILYWTGSGEGTRASIYFAANPAVWWPAWLAPSLLLFTAALSRRARRRFATMPFAICAAGFFGSWLPLLFIDRVSFLYHALPATFFGIAALCLAADRLPDRITRPLMLFFAAAAVLGFLAFTPVAYGIPLPEGAAAWYTALFE